MGQTAAVHEIHRQEVLVADDADFMHRDDIGVLQPGGGLGLDVKAFHLGRAGQPAGQDHLDRDHAI